MKFVFPAIIIFIMPIFQFTFLPIFSIQYFTPDLFLIITIYFSIATQSHDKDYLFGLGLGFLQDLVGGGITGTNTLSKGLLGLLSHITVSKFFRVNLLTILFFIFFGSFLDSILLFSITRYLLEKGLSHQIFMRTMLIKFSLNTLLGVPVILCLVKIEEALQIRKKSEFHINSL
jgi:rod shape-determining protein MreD